MDRSHEREKYVKEGTPDGERNNENQKKKQKREAENIFFSGGACAFVSERKVRKERRTKKQTKIWKSGGWD
jgi:hypothetical protein